jgi:hypothetical protein
VALVTLALNGRLNILLPVATVPTVDINNNDNNNRFMIVYLHYQPCINPSNGPRKPLAADEGFFTYLTMP